MANKYSKKLILDERIGEMAAKLAGVEKLRVWHDQALIKRPWANPTSWHLDTPFGLLIPDNPSHLDYLMMRL